MKFIWTILLLFGTVVSGWAQPIPVNAGEESLLSVLKDLRKAHGVQFSGSNKVLSGCQVSLSMTFETVEAAMDELLAGCDLKWSLSHEVYLISPIIKQTKPVSNQFRGEVRDKSTGEVLPYAVLLFKDSGELADEQGNFSISEADRKLRVRISHVAYEPLDTFLIASKFTRINLNPKQINLEEVRITDGEGPFRLLDPSQIKILSAETFQAGFYCGIEDFRENSPTIPWTEYPRRSNTENPSFSSYEVTFESIDLHRKEAKDIGRIFGFCDGKSIYLHCNMQLGFYKKLPRLFRGSKFAKIEFIGQYAYYESLYYFYVPGKENTGAIQKFAHLERRILDLTSGESIRLTRKQLLKFLAEDTELFQNFMQEEKRNKKLKEYFTRYIERKNTK